MPGTGKSRLGRALAEALPAIILDKDPIRAALRIAHLVWREDERPPEIGIVRKGQLRRGDADDLERLAVEANDGADDAGAAAELAAPHALAEHDHLARAVDVGVLERAAHSRCDG